MKHLHNISRIFKFSNFQIFKLFFICTLSSAQDSKLALNGYISDLQSATFDSINKNWSTENLIHNRLNFKWMPNEKFNAVVELRNRLTFGDNITNNPNAAKNYEADNGLVDMSFNLADGNSYVLNSSVDRLFASYESGKFKVTFGRQRINWGQTLVWNPNDIFNAYSFFDFDYVERPGSDALRLQYYNTEITSTELAFKLNKSKKLTAAAFHKLNIFEYDVQFLGGVLDGKDYVVGAGWSGAVKSISFRGEVSYFRPIENFSDTSGIVMASLSVDYLFPNSLMVVAEYLYTENSLTGTFNLMQYYSAPQNVKNLSFVKHNMVFQVQYPFTPLLSGSLAGMYLPKVNGYYIGPSLSYSLAQNLDASCYMQLFGADFNNVKVNMNMLFLRLKLSF
jgi:hypothetical protein